MRQRKNSWLIVARLTLDLVKTGAAYLQADIVTASTRDVIICVGIFVGQAEGRPMSSSKLSDFISMPRPTVIRRLKELEACGKAIRTDTGAWILPVDKDGRCPMMEKMFSTSLSLIHKSSVALSKLDNVNIANK